jgi:TetR/AcrR family transcriptional regulator, cholesterol catabolism regulator
VPRKNASSRDSSSGPTTRASAPERLQENCPERSAKPVQNALRKAAGHGGREGGRRESRREEVLTAAGALFARQGFEGTSMRDVAKAVGMLPGSLYYHFASKEEMFLTIHADVVHDMLRRVGATIGDATDPWEKLERAAVAHLEGLLEHGNLLAIISPNFPESREELNEHVKVQRREYEKLFSGIVDEMELPAERGRLMRLQLMGALNWTPVWYANGKGTPAEIAAIFVMNLRHGVG